MRRTALYLGVLTLSLAGCDRQLPATSDQYVSGYEIQGKVTDRIGNPIANVSVYLDYATDIEYGDSVISRRYYVTDNTATVQAVVTDITGKLVMTLTPPRTVSGWFQATWAGYDSTGYFAPSGIYHIQYTVNGQVAYSYDQLVSGGKVAVTDTYGRYDIRGRYLPIDSASIPYFSSYDSSYVGNLHVSNDVILTFAYPSRIKHVEQTLSYGILNVIDVMFQ